MKIKLVNVRLSFFNGYVPQSVKGSAPKYTVHGLLALNDPQVAGLRAALTAVAKEKWLDRAEGVLRALVAQNKICVHKGDEKINTKTGDVYPGYAGMLYISASNDIQPRIMGTDAQPLTQASGKPYSGCYADLILDVWAQDNSYGQRLNAKWLGVQFRRDGDPLGVLSVASPDDFTVIDEAPAGAPQAQAGDDGLDGLAF